MNELDVRSALHKQVSLTAVNHNCVIHEAMNGCKKSKDPLKACFENVNISILSLNFQLGNYDNMIYMITLVLETCFDDAKTYDLQIKALS